MRKRTLAVAALATTLVALSCGETKYSNTRTGGSEAVVEPAAPPKVANGLQTFSGPDSGAAFDHGFTDNSAFPRQAGLALDDASQPRLAFSGAALNCASVPGGSITKAWTQSRLFGLYQGQQNFFAQAIASLQETDDMNFRRPSPAIGAVHPDLRVRLGRAGVEQDFWQLAHVRFRANQIKLYYEDSIPDAMGDETIEYAGWIHIISIPPGAVLDRYQAAVNALETPAVRARRLAGEDDVGCDLLSLLETYLPQGQYQALHTNIFDRKDGIDEWRLSELMAAKKNRTPTTPLPVIFERVPVNGLGDGVELSVVPMGYQRYKVRQTNLVPIANSVVKIWFSGDRSDANIFLVVDDMGMPVSPSNVVFNNSATMTCVQCHNSQFGVPLSDGETTMPTVHQNHFRMIAWGLTRPFGFPRVGGAGMSEFYERLLQQRTPVAAGTVVKP